MWVRSLGREDSLEESCLESRMDRGAWRARVRGVTGGGHFWSSWAQHSFPSILVHWFLRCWCSLLSSPAWPCPVYLDSRTQRSRFRATLFSTALDFTFAPRHFHSWVSFLLWPSRFMLSGAIRNCPPLFLSSILDTMRPGELIFLSHVFAFSYISWGSWGKNMEWAAIFSSRGSRFVTALHNSPFVLDGAAQQGSQPHWVTTRVPLPWQGCESLRGSGQTDWP